MGIEHHAWVGTFHSPPSVSTEDSVPHRDPRLQINGLVNQHDEESKRHAIQVFDEHGRFYYYTTHNMAVYPFPIDQHERDTLLEFHHLIHGNALNEKLYNADLRQCPPGYGRRQVLDVGCGTGFWCYEMARDHPDMDIHGMDLFVNHPLNDPTPERSGYDAPQEPNMPNLTYHMPVDFTKDQWLPFREGSFDFIRAARLCGSVPDWGHLYWCIFRYLKPGGFIEHIELDFEPRTMRGYQFPLEAMPLSDWWDKMKFASTFYGRPMEYRQQDLQELLETMGFANFNHQTVRIPLKRYPDGAWEKYLVETFICALMGTGQNLVTGPLAGLTLGLCNAVWEALKIGLNKDTPVYFNIHILTAKKPMR